MQVIAADAEGAQRKSCLDHAVERQEHVRGSGIASLQLQFEGSIQRCSPKLLIVAPPLLRLTESAIGLAASHQHRPKLCTEQQP